MTANTAAKITPELIDHLRNVRDYIRFGASRFNEAELYFGHGSDNAWDDALALVLHALHLGQEGREQILDARLTPGEGRAILTLFIRRIEGRIPVPYLIGEAWFAGLKFKVDERVLIPRSPIAELIEAGFSPWLADEPTAILDLCTGGGCIGIGCAYAFPAAAVVLSDISADALVVAGENIVQHELSSRVSAVESDLFAGIDQRFDLIVSNPPYVDAPDYGAMPPEYHREPALALESGDDGLDFTRRLLREAAEHLNESGILVVEVGNSAVHLEAAFPDVPFTWLEFERGGYGVFVLTQAELLAHAPDFA
ncbi:MAG: 50S ribosomal protein L3 N(5)-glutamine methyltransferase [Gammaproteobacteria bacterium]|nr:MAG: 50S ribosomal protein L3 N(5)-glutamine methyltransferase [Gammaproteobacteria bacterium]